MKLGFSSLLHDCVLNELSAQEEMRPVHAMDRAFFAILNDFLISEGCDCIRLDEEIPSNFAQRLAQAIDVGTVHQTRGEHNEGDSALACAVSLEHNHKLSGILGALAVYLEQLAVPIQVGRDIWVEQGALGEVDKQCALWRQAASGGAEKVDVIELDKPVVICLSGVGGVTSNPKEMEGIMRQASVQTGPYVRQEGALKDVSFYGVSYPTDYRIRMTAQTAAYNANADEYRVPAAQAVFDNYVRPHFDALFERNPKANVADLKKLAGQIRFYSYSFGTVVTRCVANSLAEYLEGRGVSTHDIQQVLEQVFVLNVNPTHRLDDENDHGHFTTLHLVSKNDNAARARAYHERLVPEDERHKKQTFVPISENEMMLFMDAPVGGMLVEPQVEKRAHNNRDTVRNCRVSDGLYGVPKTEQTGHHAKLTTTRMFSKAADGLYDYHNNGLYPEVALKHAMRDVGALEPKQFFQKVKLGQLPANIRPLASMPERWAAQVDVEKMKVANQNKRT